VAARACDREELAGGLTGVRLRGTGHPSLFARRRTLVFGGTSSAMRAELWRVRDVPLARRSTRCSPSGAMSTLLLTTTIPMLTAVAPLR
jgi:hypothetical protein